MRIYAFVFVAISFLFFGCEAKETIIFNEYDGADELYFCGAESYDTKSKSFVSDSTFFKGGIKDSLVNYSGENSCMLDKKHQYGMTLEFYDLHPGEIIKASVYRKSENDNGALVIASSKKGVYAARSKTFAEKKENGWEKLSLNIQLPLDIDSLKSIRVYVFYNGEDSVYFDNLNVARYYSSLKKEEVSKGLEIKLTDADYKELFRLRDVAVKQGIITKNLKKKFEGFVNFEGKSYRAEIKLKGDWTDHLKGNKWSFRVSILDGEAIMGLKTFSIQSPEIRDFLNEWVTHELCMKEDILTTRMEYLPVSINGIDMGVYNLEEHFVKQLVEAKNRREGPILKFLEESFWECNVYYKNTGVFPFKPYYEASTISLFKVKKTLKSPKLRAQFLIAQNLMYKYKQGDPDVENYLDIKRMAKNYALMDLCNVDHSNNWHNQRLYYNSVNSKLEPIVYDCYPGIASHNKPLVDIRANVEKGIHLKDEAHGYVTYNLFNNEQFMTYYVQYINKYTSEEFLKEAYEPMMKEIDSLENVIGGDYIDYKFNRQFLYNNAKELRKEIAEFEAKVKNKEMSFDLKPKLKDGCETEHPLKHISLSSHIEVKRPNGSVELSLKNFHCEAIKVVGYKTKAFKDSIVKINGPTLKKHSANNGLAILKLPTKPKKLYYKVVGKKSDTLYKSSSIVSWPRPTGEIPYKELMVQDLSDSPLYKVQENEIIFNKGSHTISNTIVIPKGYTVIINEGTTLDFVQRAGFVSYSNVRATGTESEKITVRSSDGTARGFTVLNPEIESALSHVDFDGLNTFDFDGWTLTGAVTFFETKVNFDNCKFMNNHCEDGLNLIQTKFMIESCTVSGTYSDGFDGDFCIGTVRNSIFKNTGNDCLDFSGSTITVEGCTIENSGDKGISCGEASTITIDNVTINGAVIGIASKDKSIAIIKNIELSKCEKGFVAFRKKSEYGPATLEITNYKVENVQQLEDIEEGSKITYN